MPAHVTGTVRTVDDGHPASGTRALLPAQRRPGAAAPSAAAPVVASTLVADEVALAREAERVAVAGRLHDEVAQALVVARFGAELARRGGPDAVGEVLTALAEATGTVRTLMTELQARPASDLAAALVRLARLRPEIALHVEGLPRSAPGAGAAAYAVVGAVQSAVVEVSTGPDGSVHLALSGAEPGPGFAEAVDAARRVGVVVVECGSRWRLMLPPPADEGSPTGSRPGAPTRLGTVTP